MTDSAKRDAARDELLRLLKGLEFYRAWRLAGIKAANGEIRQEDLNMIVEPSTAFLEYFDNAGGRYSQILQFVREWYSHTYSDFCLLMNTGGEEVSSEIRKFLSDFRNEAGFEFQFEAGLVAKTVRKVLKSGKIARENDYYILKELENSVDQTILTAVELSAVTDLLRHFESR
ncbi:MAG: hypothetical protein AAGI09_14470 [Pseudomonadota bacterium]